jgi:hypothetical protein
VFRSLLNLDVTTRAWAFDLICYIYVFQIRVWIDKYVKDLARDNTKILLNKIWELPKETTVEEAIVAKLPAPTFNLSRKNHFQNRNNRQIGRNTHRRKE